jgi:hypothetical protein
MTGDAPRQLDVAAALEPLLRSYSDLLSVSRDLANRAAAGGQLGLADLGLHQRFFETVEAQLVCLQALVVTARTGAGPVDSDAARRA